MIPGARLLPYLSAPYLKRRKLRIALVFVSVMLAVSLFVATRTTDRSIVRSFERSNDALLGGAQFFITQGVTVRREVLPALERVAGVRAAPVVQHPAIANRLGVTVTVVGIDYVRDARLRRYKPVGEIDLATLLLNPRAVVIPRSLAARYRLTVGQKLALSADGGTHDYRIGGIVRDEGPAAALAGRIVVMPVTAAQELFAAPDRYDRIDLALDPPATADAVRRALPEGCSLMPARQSNPILDFSLAQMRAISLAVTLMAAMIGLFIVYNSMSLAVVERTHEIGVWRALGARRIDVGGLLVCEAVAIALPASLAGMALGVLLAKGMVLQAAANMNMLVALVDITRIDVPFDVWALAPCLGVATAVAGTIAPARAAARVEPVVALNRAAALDIQSVRLWRWFLLAMPLGVGAMVLALHPRTPRPLAVCSVVTAILALALAMPQVVVWLAAPARAVARQTLGIETYLAFDNIAKFPARTALTVVAFAGSLSIVVAVGATVSSLEGAVVRWMDCAFGFDISIQANPLRGNAYTGVTFPDSLLADVAEDPRVADVCGIRSAICSYGQSAILLVAYDAETLWRMATRRGRADAAQAEAIVRDLKRGTVAVSDNFGRLHGIDVGDHVTLDVPGGSRTFEVTRRWEDYSWPMGTIMLDRALYVTLWKDRSLSFMNVQINRPEDVDALQRDLTRRLRAEAPLYVHKTAEIKAYASELVADWFKLAHAQVLVAIVIGAVGVANTLFVSLLGQSRQIGLVRAVGATQYQIRRMLLTEAGLLGAASALLGVTMGIAMSGGLIPRFLIRETGYSFTLVMPWASILFVAVAGVVIALGASLFPIRSLRRSDVVQAIGVE